MTEASFKKDYNMALQIFKVPEYPEHLGMEGKPAVATPLSAYISKIRIKTQKIQGLFACAQHLCAFQSNMCNSNNTSIWKKTRQASQGFSA